MNPIDFAAILSLVGNAMDLALLVARVLQRAGCAVTGCPADMPAEGPTMRAAREQAQERARDDADEVLRRSSR